MTEQGSAEESPSAALSRAIDRFAAHHPGNACVDCLTLVYQAGVLDAGEAAEQEMARLAIFRAENAQPLPDDAASPNPAFRSHGPAAAPFGAHLSVGDGSEQ